VTPRRCWLQNDSVCADGFGLANKPRVGLRDIERFSTSGVSRNFFVCFRWFLTFREHLDLIFRLTFHAVVARLRNSNAAGEESRETEYSGKEFCVHRARA